MAGAPAGKVVDGGRSGGGETLDRMDLVGDGSDAVLGTGKGVRVLGTEGDGEGDGGPKS
jgi:hypothetical protein